MWWVLCWLHKPPCAIGSIVSTSQVTKWGCAETNNAQTTQRVRRGAGLRMWVYWILNSHGRSTLRRGNALGRRAELSSRGTVTGVGGGFSLEVRSQDRPMSALFKYLKKTHRWVDRFCGAPMDRSRVRCSKEKYFHWAWGRILANVRASPLRLLWKAGVARCWRETKQRLLTLGWVPKHFDTVWWFWNIVLWSGCKRITWV